MINACFPDAVNPLAPRDGHPEVRAWLGKEDRELEDVGGLPAAQRAAGRAELNHVTGLAAARLVAALVAGHDVPTHLPRPLGLQPFRGSGGSAGGRLVVLGIRWLAGFSRSCRDFGGGSGVWVGWVRG
ncbi:hypothetical protein AB0K48_11595 [Nonomuraea sp. NPDC055795]